MSLPYSLSPSMCVFTSHSSFLPSFFLSPLLSSADLSNSQTCINEPIKSNATPYHHQECQSMLISSFLIHTTPDDGRKVNLYVKKPSTFQTEPSSKYT